MEIRNPIYAADGANINCEIHHPDLGWIAYTAASDQDDPLAIAIWGALIDMDIADASPTNVVALKAASVEQVKTRHAKMLVKLSGDYSSEERET